MAQRATESDFTLDTAAALAAYEEPEAIRGRSPWYLAWRRLRRNYVAFFFLFVFIVVLVSCALAPVYAKHVAGTGPNTNHILETVKVNGNGDARRLAWRRHQTGKLVASDPDRPDVVRRAAASSCSAPTRTDATSPFACSTAAARRSSSGSSPRRSASSSR